MAYPDPPPEDFGQRLRRLARERGYKNKALAKLTGAHEVTVSRWMAGAIPEATSLAILTEILDVDLGYLLEPTKRKAIRGTADRRARGKRVTRKKSEEKEG